MKIKTSDIKRIIEMLDSPDEDNQILGLSLLNTVNFHTYRGELILLQKFCNPSNDSWKIHAPEAYEYIKDLKIEYNSKNRPNLNISIISISDLSGIFRMLKCNERVKRLHEKLFTKHVYERLERTITPEEGVEITVNIKIKSYE